MIPQPKNNEFTVGELSEYLRQFPQDAKILARYESYAVRRNIFVGHNGYGGDPTKATIVEIEVLDL